ncbi:MAG TPA: DNA polymerase III subunit delta, partial [Vulgatibacter sp.]
KVVWLREPEFLAPRKAAKGDQLGRLRELWEQGREKEAARRLLALAQKAGLDPDTATAAEWKAEAGLDPDAADLAFCRDAAVYAKENGVMAPATDASELEALLEKGFPKGHHLVISATSLDGRLSLYKKLEKAGEAISYKPQGREKRDVAALCREVLAASGKKLSPAAAARLEELVGGEQMRLLHAELEKVALFVGDRRVVEAEDVDAVVEASRDVEFLLTNSLEKRDLHGALEGLAQLLEDGGGLPQAVASIAGCVRQLLAAQEATRATGGRIPGFGAAAAGWVAEFNAAGLKMGNPNAAKFKAEAAARFGRGELVRALVEAADVDVAVKSGGGRLDVEKLLWGICEPAGGRR